MSAAKRGSKKGMSDAHKKALAEGRQQGAVVRRYLEALEANKPKRGRRRTPESIKKRLEKIDAEIATAKALKRLELNQEKLDLEAELSRNDQPVDLSSLEKEFVKVAKAYSERKGISYAAWRASGVSAQTLKAAGISRAS